jgi:hypothetical protein
MPRLCRLGQATTPAARSDRGLEHDYAWATRGRMSSTISTMALSTAGCGCGTGGQGVPVWAERPDGAPWRRRDPSGAKVAHEGRGRNVDGFPLRQRGFGANHPTSLGGGGGFRKVLRDIVGLVVTLSTYLGDFCLYAPGRAPPQNWSRRGVFRWQRKRRFRGLSTP